MDLVRTLKPSEEKGKDAMSRVLQAFSKYDNTIGYVQGMNHIVDALMQHSREEVAFWLFVTLIEDFEMRDIYQPGLHGVYKHNSTLEALIKEHMPKLFEHLERAGVMPEMFASGWLLTLYFNSIPLSVSDKFLTNFFEDGWAFYYRFTITYLKALESKILSYDETENGEILELIKTPKKAAQDVDTSVSLISSIGRFFAFTREVDSCVETLGCSLDAFKDGTAWLKVIEASEKLKEKI